MKSMKLIMESFRKNLKEMELEQEETEEIPEEVKEMLANEDIEDFRHGLFFLEDIGINFDKNELIDFLVSKQMLPNISRYHGTLDWDWDSKERIKLQKQVFWELLRLNMNFENTEYYSSVADYGFNFFHDLEYADQLGKLTGLMTLSMSSLELTEVPESIKNLKNLRRLDLSDNKLTEIPEWIVDLRYLDNLDLSRNNLTELPEWIGNLPVIRTINLKSNKLTTLPNSIANLENSLEELYLQNNNFSSEEMEQINQVLLQDTYIRF